MKIKTSLKRRIFALVVFVAVFTSFMVIGISATNDINYNALYTEFNINNSEHEQVDIDCAITPDNLGQVLCSDEIVLDGFDIAYALDTAKNDVLFTFQNNSSICTSDSGALNFEYTFSNFKITRDGAFNLVDNVTIEGSGWIANYFIEIDCHDPSTGAVYNGSILPEDDWLDIGDVITANDVFRVFNVDGDVIVVDNYTVFIDIYFEGYDLKDVVINNTVTFDIDSFLGGESDNSPTNIEYIFMVFTTIGNWLITVTNNIMPMFYGVNGLTFVGCLSVCGLAISVFLLMAYVIDKFLGGGG